MLMALEVILLYEFFFLQHCNSAPLKVLLFSAQSKSAFAQFMEVDPAFEKQYSISNSKIQILITA